MNKILWTMAGVLSIFMLSGTEAKNVLSDWKPSQGMGDFQAAGETFRFRMDTSTSCYTQPQVVDVEAESARFLQLELESPTPGNIGVGAHFTRRDSPLFDEEKRVFPRHISLTGKVQKVTFDLKSVGGPEWRGNIKQLRLDFIDSPGQVLTVRRVLLLKDLDYLDGVGWAHQGRRHQSVSFPDLVENVVYELQLDVDGRGEAVVHFADALEKELTGSPLRFTLPEAGGKVSFRFAIPDGTALTAIEIIGPGNMQARLLDSGEKCGWNAHWIVHPKLANRAGTSFLATTITLRQPVDGRIQMTADDRFKLIINGKTVKSQSGFAIWEFPDTVNVADFLRDGENQILVECGNDSGAAGMLFNGRFWQADGTVVELNSDPQWRAGLTPDRIDTPVLDLGMPPVTPWRHVSYEPLLRRGQVKLVSFSMPDTLTPGGKLPIKIRLSAAKLAEPVRELTFVAEFDQITPQKIQCRLPRPLVRAGDEIEADFQLEFNRRRFGGISYLLKLENLDLAGGSPIILGSFRVPEPPREPPVRAELKERNGYTEMTLNGRPFFYNGFQEHGRRTRTQELELLNLGVEAVNGSFSGTITCYAGGAIAPFWLGIDRYDFARIDKALSTYLAMKDDVNIIVSIGLDAPEWWARENPDECVRFWEAEKPEGLSSPASLKLRADVGKMLHDAISHLEHSRFASRIIGYRIMSQAMGGEYQYPGGWIGKMDDYGPAMLTYFRTFLRQKYRNNEQALQTAWRNPAVTFASAKIPDGEKRRKSELGVFRDQETVADVIDYLECHNRCMADWIIYGAKIARESAPGKLIGCYGCFLLGFYNGFQLLNNGHLEFEKVFDSGYIDFVCVSQHYDLRRPGLPSGCYIPNASLRLRKIKLISEDDTRTHSSPGETGSLTHSQNLFEDIGLLKRNFIYNLCNDGAIYFFDMGETWFTDKGTLELIAACQRIGNASLGFPAPFRAQTALLFSAESAYTLAVDSYPVTTASSFRLMKNLGTSGVPYDAYLLDDIVRDDFPIDNYRCFILVNAFAPTEKQRQAIEAKLKKQGRTLIWGYAPGAFRGGKLSLSSMETLTGFSFGVATIPEALQMKTTVPVADLIGGVEPVAPAFWIEDPKAEALGRFASSGRVAFARKQNPEWTSICSLVSQLSPAILRELQRQAGAHVFCETTDPVYYNGRFAGIHSASDGVKTIHLPVKSNVYDVFRQTKVAENSDKITTQMRYLESNLYFLGTAEEWQAFLKAMERHNNN